MNVFNGINCKLPFTRAWVVVHIIQFLPYKFINLLPWLVYLPSLKAPAPRGPVSPTTIST